MSVAVIVAGRTPNPNFACATRGVCAPSAPSGRSDHSDGSLLPLPMDADGLAAASADRHEVGAPPDDAGQPRRALFITAPVTDTTCACSGSAPQSTTGRTLQSLHSGLMPRGIARVHSLGSGRDSDVSLGWRTFAFAGLLACRLDDHSTCTLCHGRFGCFHLRSFVLLVGPRRGPSSWDRRRSMASRVGAGVCASALAPAVAAGAPSRKQWMHIGCAISRTAESCAYRPVCVPVARGRTV